MYCSRCGKEINNDGELQFNSYSKYKTTSSGIVIYQIKYNTFYDSVKSYQLVSLNKDNTSVAKSTNVYGFYVNYDGSLTGDKNQYEYEAEKIWGKLQEMLIMYCKNCGKEIKEGNTFCTNCGKPINNLKETTTKLESKLNTN